MKNYRSHARHSFALTVLFSTLFIANFVSAQTMVQTAVYTRINSMIGGYYQALPSDYSSTTKSYPLLVFLHGAGEVGDGSPSQLPAVLRNGPPKLISQGTFPGTFTVNSQTFSFIVISPQVAGRDETGSSIQSLIDYLVGKYRVDQSRIYLTGLSMGGGSTWIYSATTTGAARLAAIATMCGNSPPYPGQPGILAKANLAVWALHNQYDDICPVSYTTDWVSQLNAQVPAINPQAKMTIFNATGHDCWTKGYDPNYRENSKNVYEWMLQYSRSGTTTTTNQPPVVNAGADQNITLPVSSVTLNGNATDADGSIVSYQWTKVSGGAAVISSLATSSTLVTGLVQGSYSFRLTATDNKGATSYDDVIVNVAAATSTGTYTTIPAKLEAEAATLYGVQTETTQDAGGGLDVGWIDLGDYMDFKVNVTTAATFTLNFRVASPNNTAQFLVKRSDGTTLATVSVPNTGGYQVWKTITASVALPVGNQTLRVVSSNAQGWNLNWVDFTTTSTVVTPPPTTTTRVEAETYTSMSGVKTETTQDAGGGLDVGWIDNNDWMDYSVTTAAAGSFTLNFRVASPYYGGQFQVRKSDGTVLATVNVPNTGGYQSWQTISASANLALGAQTLRIYATVQPWNINWLELVSGSTTAKALNAGDAELTNDLSLSATSVKDKFKLTINNTVTGSVKITVEDSSGVSKREFGVAKSDTGAMQTYLSIGDLPAGTYTLKVQMDGWVETKKITKL